MILDLTDFLRSASDTLVIIFLVFLRVGSALFVLPVFGEMVLPVRLRLGIAIALSLIIHPMIDIDLEKLWTSASILLQILFSEIFIGLIVGLLLRLHIMSLQIAATIAAQSTSLSQLLGSNTVDPQPAIGLILYVAALALAVELGLHVQLTVMFAITYDIVGVGATFKSESSNIIRDTVVATFRFGFILAAPFVAASILYNLALGVINRAMPQLMVAFVGAPAITLGALVLLALTGPLMLALWLDRFQLYLRNPFGID
ncbi:MAG: flagellar biosynthetic protein FliR [Pseudomonadota bacterium]